MFPLPEAIIAVLVPFAPLFSRPVWVHVPVWVAGALLCRGPRTIAAVLRVVGLGEERQLARYHRVLSRARESGLLAAKILLGWLLAVLPESIARTTPVLFGWFSWVCLMGLRWCNAQPLTPQTTAWYPKTEATFADGLAAVRRHRWAGRYFTQSTAPGTPVELPRQDWETLLDQLAAAA